MIRSYGFSITGSSHVSKGTICQDANKVRELANGMVIAAVADGVGSCKYSDVSSRIAVDVSTAFCEEKLKIGLNNSEFVKLIEEAFNHAELAIENQSLNDKQPLSEYDTTLDLVIYDGKRISYGHCGDGGIVGLTIKGDYLKVTSPQKKDGIYVVPLRNGSKSKNNTWVFGCVEDELTSVLLATDGVYDTFFPYLLKNQPVEVYVPLVQYFMDNNGIHVSKKNIAKISGEREAFLNGSSCESITDDKTVLVLINEDSIPERKDDSFYKEPDWNFLQLEWNKKAYPHLYEKKEEIATNSMNSDTKQSSIEKAKNEIEKKNEQISKEQIPKKENNLFKKIWGNRDK